MWTTTQHDQQTWRPKAGRSKYVRQQQERHGWRQTAWRAALPDGWRQNEEIDGQAGQWRDWVVLSIAAQVPARLVCTPGRRSHCRQTKPCPHWRLYRRMRRLYSATVAKNGDCRALSAAVFSDSRRFRWQIVAEIGDYNLQCGQAISLSVAQTVCHWRVAFVQQQTVQVRRFAQHIAPEEPLSQLRTT